MNSIEQERYRRQLSLPTIGEAGQKRLSVASVLVIGAGGLGSPVLQYLAAAGVGHLCILDGDVVSVSNLNRQILYGTEDVGKPKAELAAQRLRHLNDTIEVSAVTEWLAEKNCHRLIRCHDAVAFCLDSIPVRRLANRACVEMGIPYVDGGVSGWNGSIMTVLPGHTPCYACVYRNAKPVKHTVSVLGAMAGIVGCYQALATIRLLLGHPDPSQTGILLINGLTYQTNRIPAVRDPDCPVCGAIHA